MSTFRPLVLLVLFVGLACSFPAIAKKSRAPIPEDHRILIDAVDASAMQVTFIFKNTGQLEDYTVDGMTQVTVGTNSGGFKDIKAGQEVFAYVERDAHSLDSLTVGTADPGPKAPKTPKPATSSE